MFELKEKVFIDKSKMPTKELLEKNLGICYQYYDDLTSLAKKFEIKWTFYKGWSLKFFSKNKALFYGIPHHNSFTLSMAIRENEKQKMLEDGNLNFIHPQLRDSKKFREGYAIQITIENEQTAKLGIIFIKELITMRIP